MGDVQMSLLNNAIDSLRHGVDVLAFDDLTRANRNKQAILSISHSAELLLKERLFRVNPALVFENVDSYPSPTARTVSAAKALSRLQKIGNVVIDPDDVKKLTECMNLRNAIMHYEVNFSPKIAKAMLGKVLSFVFDFAQRELNKDLRKEFTNDDTWQVLLIEFDEFTAAHGTRVADAQESEKRLGECLICGEMTLDLDADYCELCGVYLPSIPESEYETGLVVQES